MFNNIDQIKTIDIIVISEGLEAIALRSVLEALGIQVRMHYIGNVQHLISLFQNPKYLHPIVIFSCHGDEDSMIIPELSSDLEKQMPYNKKLTSNDFTKILNLNDQIIINTGCCLGTKEFSNSFLSRGASKYIGVSNYIEGNAVILFIVTLFYFYFSKKYSIIEAFNKAQEIDKETKIFKIW